jgi:hypothetical protein
VAYIVKESFAHEFLFFHQVLCSHFFQHFNSYVEKNKLSSKMMHQKIHEIFQNLKRENNVALRRRIVIGELSLNELLDLDAKVCSQ